jgi:transcriptional regulator with XRE-family HTH domain
MSLWRDVFLLDRRSFNRIACVSGMRSKKTSGFGRQTLGGLLKKWRKKSRLSQRTLGRRLHVSASLVCYIEKGERRPSLLLLANIADLIGIEKRQALVLDRPSCRSVLAGNRMKSKDVWRRFRGDRGLLARNRVTSSELKVLKQFSKLGKVANPRYFLAVLNSIRQAIEEE